MKRVGLIDNLSQIDRFVGEEFHAATARDVMVATGGNTGNVAFVFGARKMLGNPMVRVGWGWTPETVRQRCDHLVVCCANQIGRHADLGEWAARLEQFELPVTLLGLGAQADSLDHRPEIPEGTLRFLQAVDELRACARAPNVAVRGAYTQDVLRDLGFDSVAAGCPSLHISSRKGLGQYVLSRQPFEAFSKVAIAAGNPWHGPSAALEKILVDIADRFEGDYVIQHPVSMLEVAYGEREVVTGETAARFLAVYGDRFSDMPAMYEWYRRKSIAFVDVPNWMRFLRRFDVVLGPRYHGVALAVQADVPGCVVTIDSRTQELCNDTAVKNIGLEQAMGATADELVELARWHQDDADAFDANRQVKARTFVEYLTGNGLVPSKHLLELAA